MVRSRVHFIGGAGVFMRRLYFQFIVTGIVLCVTSTLIADAASEAANVFNQLYKPRIDRAVASRDTADNVALANELLSATGEVGDSTHLFALMCENAYALTNRVPAGYDTAIRAMRMLVKRVPNRTLDGLLKIADIRNRLFRAARGDERASVGAELIDDYVKAGDVAHGQGDLAGAARIYQRAIPVCSVIRSAERMGEVKAKITHVKSRLLIRREIETYTKRLAANPDDRETHGKLVKLCVVDLDRPKNALEHLKFMDDDDVQRQLVPMAVKRLDELEADECNKLAQWYMDLSKRANASSKPAMLTRAKLYLDWYLSLHQESDLHRARALLVQKDLDQRLEKAGGPVPVSLVIAAAPVEPKIVTPPVEVKPVRPTVFPKGMIAYWKFNEGEGDTAKDSVGGQNGTFRNGAEWVMDNGRPAVAFRGGGSHVATTFKRHMPEFTFGAWVKPDRPPHVAMPAGPFHYEKNFQINWNHRSSGSRGAIIVKTDTWRATAIGPLPANRWHHITGSYDGETIRAYVNGVLVSVNTSPSGPPQQETRRLVFGTNAVNRRASFGGMVRDAMIFDRALSDDEVAVIAMRKPANREAKKGLIANWNFDARSGPVLKDTSGNGFHGVYFPSLVPGTRAADPLMKSLIAYGGSFASLGSVGNFEHDDSFSFGGWVYPARYRGFGGLISKMEHRAPLRGYELWIDNRRPGVHMISHWQNSNAIKVRTVEAMNVHEWHHVMATYDGSSKASGVTIYVNGEAAELEVIHDTLSGTIRNPAPMHLFSRNGNWRTQVMLDDVRVYGQRLSEAEIQPLAAKPPTTAFPLVVKGAPVKVNTLSDGLVGHWPFDEGAGTTARDATGNGNDGKLAGDVSWTKGRSGGALSFGRRGSYVVIGNPARLNFDGQITLAAWVRLKSVGPGMGIRSILAHGLTRSPDAETDLRLRDGHYAINTWNGRDRGAAFAIPPSDKGQWFHIAGMWDGQYWRLYRNGALVGVRERDRGAVTVESDWVIGANGNKSGRWFPGDIDDVRIYNRALSIDEIHALVNLAPKEPGRLPPPPGGNDEKNRPGLFD